MKLSRRKLFGAAAGAAVATQMDKAESSQFAAHEAKLSAYPSKFWGNTPANIQQDWKANLKQWQKILDGDFSDWGHRFENHTRIKREMNITCLKSVSATAQHTMMERAENKVRREELIKQAKEEIDRIIKLPFSITGLLFDE